MRKSTVFAAFLFLSVLASCSSDPYETGDGKYSYMRADFVEANTDASSTIVSISTDDGEQLRLTDAVKTSWAAKPDTAYRALIYYNKVLSGNGDYVAEPVGLSQVLTPRITLLENMTENVITDPVVFESAWKSSNGKFINFDLDVKTGTVDGDSNGHTIGIVCDEVVQRDDGTSLVRLRLYHDQGGVPEYYSAKLYLSIPVSFMPITLSEGDEVEVGINTYDGLVTKTFGF